MKKRNEERKCRMLSSFWVNSDVIALDSVRDAFYDNREIFICN